MLIFLQFNYSILQTISQMHPQLTKHQLTYINQTCIALRKQRYLLLQWLIASYSCVKLFIVLT